MNKKRYYIDLLLVLTKKEMKVKYKSSFLGYLWSVANPLAFAFVFYIAFKVVMKIQMEEYVLFLITGLFPWQWFANSINASSMVFLSNTSIIKKVNFPRQVLPLAAVLQDMIHFILAIPVIILFMLIYHHPISWGWIYGIPALLGAQFLMTYGLSLVISSANLFFRDIERITTIFTTLLFYFTPVIYAETMIPERYKVWVNLNPLAPLTISWRRLFLTGNLEAGDLFVSYAYGIIFFGVGFFVYKKLSWKFAEVL
jgi:lipopolysaccharide transport system permease protein